MVFSTKEYTFRFRTAADSVRAKRYGSISETRFFIDNYRTDCYPVLEECLSDADEHVRAETIILLSRLGIKRPEAKIREMMSRERDLVVMACIAYVKAIEVSDAEKVPLMHVLEHRGGTEFADAAKKMGYIATADDLPALRRIYGQVRDGMREQIRDVLVKIIERDPDLDAKREFILSVPGYPDEKAFLEYVDRAMDYLDVRYRKNVEPRRTVSVKVHNQVARAILQMQIRLYNERENFRYYSSEASLCADELEELIAWAAQDLNSKKIQAEEEELGRVRGIREY